MIYAYNSNYVEILIGFLYKKFKKIEKSYE